MVRNVLSQELCATNLKQSRVALIVGVPIAISITTIILYSLWSIQGTVAHVAGCGSHLIAGLDALQRYQGDTNGILNGIGSKLNGLQAQDRQSFVTGYQYLRDNCVNTINALQGFYFYFCF